MPITQPATTTADLLLDTLERVSLGSSSAAELVKQFRGGLRDRSMRRRIDGALEALAIEGLIASRYERGTLVHRCTQAGTEALERHGRFANEGTVLFTDLVGSTELIDRFGETGAHERRLRHFWLLREAITRTGGREVKGLGDGLMVVFADPADAMRCATLMQQGVADDPHQLGLRVGIHTGELLREDDDFHGSTVIIAARLCNTADAGQIIVSDATRSLTGATRAHAFQSLGQLALKGLSQPVAAGTLWWSQRAAGTPVPVAAA